MVAVGSLGALEGVLLAVVSVFDGGMVERSLGLEE